MARPLPDSLVRLSEDHLGIRASLNALKRHAEAVARGAGPDPLLLSGLLRDLDLCQRQFHHALEEMVCDALMRRAPQRAAAIAANGAEHIKGARYVAAFALAVRNVLLDTQGYRRAFCRAAQDLVAFKRAHMRDEETLLYQYALDTLTGEDWLAIDGYAAVYAPQQQPEQIRKSA